MTINDSKSDESLIDGRTRLAYIDITKGIGISMIVWAHVNGFGGSGCIALAVPLFFIISGFLYNKELPVKEYVKRKTLTLYLPFLLCNLIWPTFILFHNFQAGQPVMNNIIYILLIILTLKKDGFLFGATWFLASLFLTVVTYKIMDVSIKTGKYKDYFIAAIYFFIACIACKFMSFADMDLRRTLILPVFFVIGVLAKSNIVYIKQFFNKYTMTAACFVFAVFEAYLAKAGLAEYSYNSDSLYHLLMFIISSSLFACIIIYLSKIKADNMNNKVCKLFSYLGQNSLYILLFHFVFFEILTTLFLKVNNIPIYMIDRFPHAIKTDGIWWLVYFLIGLFGPIFAVNVFRECKLRCTSWSGKIIPIAKV